jgi:hypothetical protein
MLAGLAMMSSLITIFSALYGLIGDELVTHGFSFAGPHAFRTIVLGTLAFFLAIIFAVGVTSRQRHVASKLEAL